PRSSWRICANARSALLFTRQCCTWIRFSQREHRSKPCTGLVKNGSLRPKAANPPSNDSAGFGPMRTSRATRGYVAFVSNEETKRSNTLMS
ncbi:hypothetical protein CN173_33340, partial [Sinorhizobium meliloti]